MTTHAPAPARQPHRPRRHRPFYLSTGSIMAIAACLAIILIIGIVWILGTGGSQTSATGAAAGANQPAAPAGISHAQYVATVSSQIQGHDSTSDSTGDIADVMVTRVYRASSDANWMGALVPDPSSALASALRNNAPSAYSVNRTVADKLHVTVNQPTTRAYTVDEWPLQQGLAPAQFTVVLKDGFWTIVGFGIGGQTFGDLN